MNNFENELRTLINKYSKENGSNTPDFILAAFMANCLDAFDQGVKARSQWYGREDKPGQAAAQALGADATAKPTQPEFKGAVCRGSYALGSACGHCERCEWERSQGRG